MSYILDALRKSEAERRQGKAPDLGQPVQMVYRPKRKPVSAVVWVALALLVNAGVLAWLFWPERNAKVVTVQEAPAVDREQSEPVPVEPAPQPEPMAETEIADPVRVSGGRICLRQQIPLWSLRRMMMSEQVSPTSRSSPGKHLW